VALSVPICARAETPNHRRPRGDELVPYIAASRLVMPTSAAVRALRARHIPSFSRQTKLACNVCHYAFPQLTPFGRLFKLNGYTLTGLETIAGGDTAHPTLKLAPIPPASAMVIASLTHLKGAVPQTQNNTTAFPDELGVFLAGEVAPKVGAFVQFTYSGLDGSFGIDNTELRFASHGSLASKDLVYGVTLHNNPTMQDVWNTTPAWGFPFVASAVAPPAIASPLLDEALSQQVLGLGAYGLWNDLVYGELTVYRSAPQGSAAPLDSSARNVGRNVMPYWRVALQHQFGMTYVMAGSYGMVAELYPSGVTGPVDRFTDVGFDAQLEHRIGAGVLIGRSTYLHERQRLNALASETPPGAANRTNSLNVVRVNAAYVPSARFTATLGYFRTTGRADSVLYAPERVTGSRAGSPDTDGAIGEVDVNAWLNTRLGVQYVAYDKFNGASRSYDGAGRRASDNDTLLVFAWIAF
jgi:hypothetical protein